MVWTRNFFLGFDSVGLGDWSVSEEIATTCLENEAPTLIVPAIVTTPHFGLGIKPFELLNDKRLSLLDFWTFNFLLRFSFRYVSYLGLISGAGVGLGFLSAFS